MRQEIPKAFISHSSCDRKFVESELVPLLTGNGIEHWFAPTAIGSGEDWPSRIAIGLESCNWFLVVLTPAAVSSEWVQAEVLWAMQNRAGRIIPILYQTCDAARLHLKLLRLQHVDYRQDLTTARANLLATWRVDSCGTQGSALEISEREQEFAEKPLFLDRAALDDIVKTPGMFQGRIFNLRAILPRDVVELTESTRKMLRLKSGYRQMPFIEVFARLGNHDIYARLPNDDYHVNVLLSADMLRSLSPCIFTHLEWVPFSYKNITDRSQITKYSLILRVRVLGHIKRYRTSRALQHGLYVELIAFSPCATHDT